LARHRRKRAASGISRVEVAVPKNDAQLLRELAQALRAGGKAAARVRAELRTLVRPDAIRTGAQLVAFLQSSPLAGVDLDLERDRSPPRDIDLGT
jgi:hypothetical protein